MLKANGGIRHHGENVTADEDISPTMENIIVLTWLRLIHPSLPALVKQRYGAELRSQTVASLKPEISQALDTLLDEINSTNDAKVLRTAFQQSLKHPQPSSPVKPRQPYHGHLKPQQKVALCADKQVDNTNTI